MTCTFSNRANSPVQCGCAPGERDAPARRRSALHAPSTRHGGPMAAHHATGALPRPRGRGIARAAGWGALWATAAAARRGCAPGERDAPARRRSALRAPSTRHGGPMAAHHATGALPRPRGRGIACLSSLVSHPPAQARVLRWPDRHMSIEDVLHARV